MPDVSEGFAKVLLKTDRFVDGLHTCVGECTHTQRACSSLKRQACIAVFAGMDVCVLWQFGSGLVYGSHLKLRWYLLGPEPVVCHSVVVAAGGEEQQQQ